MLALMPAGLINYQRAQDSTIFAQIVQNVTSNVQLTGLANINFTSTNYYFDDHGCPLTTQAGAIYTAHVNLSALNSSGNTLNNLGQPAGMKMGVYVTVAGSTTTTNYFSTILSY